MQPAPDESTWMSARLAWRLSIEPDRDEVTVTVTVAAGRRRASPPSSSCPSRARPRKWRSGDLAGVARRPSRRSSPPTRASPAAVDQALADLAALRIVDREHIRPRRHRRRCAVVHDAVRPRLAADVVDDAAVRPTLAAGVLATLAELQGRERRPGRRGAARQDPPRAAPARRRWAVRVPQPLLRHRRRHPAVRHARRRGVAVGRARRRRRSTRLRAGRRRAVDWILGDGDSNGDGFVDYRRTRPVAGSPTRAGRTRGTASLRRRLAADGADRAGRGAGLRLRRAPRRRRRWPRRSTSRHARRASCSDRAGALRQRFNATSGTSAAGS